MALFGSFSLLVENDADVFTKNVSYEILRRFRDNFVIAKEMISSPGVAYGQGGYQNGHYTTTGKSTKDSDIGQ